VTSQRILFMTEGTSLAHVARPYALAMTLDPDRYEVHFAAPSKRYTDAVLADAPFRVWPLVRTEFRARIQRLVDGLFWSEAELERGIEEDRELIRAIRPNLIVVDERPSITVSAGLEGVPTASIASVIWTDDVLPTWRQPAPEAPLPYIPGLTPAGAAIAIPFFVWLASRPINRVRRRHGLSSLGARFSTLFEADHLLFLEPPSLFRLRASIPERHHFLGSPDWSSAGPLPP
jgi:UDP:flavonoid glycosyltransferase YjiC (YdhE family)